MAFAGGKRIRPYLTVIGYGRLSDEIIPVALAQELIHIAMLMHDDVIDKDFVRHQTANINGLYRERYGRYLPADEATHYANSAGILAGDLMISEAYRLIYQADIEQAAKLQVTEQLATSIYEVVGGELLDVEAAFVDDEEFDPLKVYRYKTASYSFIGPLLSGAYSANVAAPEREVLARAGEAFGVAFQIQDDILAIFGDKSKTGKSTNTGDLSEAKRTILIKYHQHLIADNPTMLANFALFGDATATNDDLLLVAHDIEHSGAKRRAEQLAGQYFYAAEKHIEQLSDTWRRDRLLDLLTELRVREA